MLENHPLMIVSNDRVTEERKGYHGCGYNAWRRRRDGRLWWGRWRVEGLPCFGPLLSVLGLHEGASMRKKKRRKGRGTGHVQCVWSIKWKRERGRWGWEENVGLAQREEEQKREEKRVLEVWVVRCGSWLGWAVPRLPSMLGQLSPVFYCLAWSIASLEHYLSFFSSFSNSCKMNKNIIKILINQFISSNY